MYYKKELCKNVTKIIFDAKDILAVYEDFKDYGI
jgi:hypothetical protein